MATLLELLGNKNTREILEAASEDALSVSALSNKCDMSLTSVYRYVEQLAEHELLESEVRLDEDGNHYQVYNTRFKAGFIYLEDKAIKEDICRDTDDADRLIWVWKKLREQE